MKKLFLRSLFACSLLWSCQSEKKVSEANSMEQKAYLRWVGDIPHNDQIDAKDFTICNGENRVIQYFNLGNGPVYSDEKSKLINTFKSNYKPSTENKENGLIRIRFIVNCEGKAGRFRVLQSGYDYQEKEFDAALIKQLLDITKSIKNWEIIQSKDGPVDYYMYLIFKIKEGQITEILP